MQVTLKQTAALLPRLLKHGIVPYLHGSPGVGKSAIAHQIAAQYNLKVIDVRLAECDPTDLQGYPIPNHETGKTYQYPLEVFPTEDVALPINPITGKPYSGWLIILDEFSNAPQAVQSAAYKLVLDRSVGQLKLHPRVSMIAAGNLETDNALAMPMSSALMSRFAHFYIQISHEEWIDWANSEDFDYRITAFINFKPDYLYTFNPEACEQPYACPRTWAMLNKVFKDITTSDPNDLPLWASLLGDGVAAEFLAYLQIQSDIVTFDEIVADPVNAPLKDDLSIRWSVMGMVAQKVTPETIEKVLPYIDRFPDDLKVVILREIKNRHPDLQKKVPAFDNWITVQAVKILG